ncbi:MAG TPA: cupredoxin domain-containing protein [Patescibacteria group bacterium]|nr:cupredoxin domain-containing protein [Patescibacteria group bacterium]
MNSISKIIAAIIVVAIIAGGVWMFTGKSDKPANTSQSANQSDNQAVAATITYNDDGFSVSPSTVKSGSKVKITNNSKAKIELASNPHPVHTDNPELNRGDVDPGASKTFTLNTKGTWGFHNHYDHVKGGTITVE